MVWPSEPNAVNNLRMEYAKKYLYQTSGVSNSNFSFCQNQRRNVQTETNVYWNFALFLKGAMRYSVLVLS